ncbi:helix-turn-helix domain-containing protein [Eubacterium sp. MSJ-13]|uniref:helix-turn-helix domain-containing protein n=1 Tax=Eubacterium sp. MSJ-13 TaxID=2841513 RepID=UPI001C112D0C|nr:helix-turn-helix transcriptional regulator [Eubacterium sp. MSJ-13]MBU5478551.1 helix-turn-helix domain-containing protein [Eubacterium sp. MSJ-13]
MKNENLDTDEILKLIENDLDTDDAKIDFISQENLRHLLSNAINNAGYSMNKLAYECSISQSHLSDFLSNKKNLNRNKLISIFIVIGYDIDNIQKSLICFGMSPLYPRNMRDFIIMKSIKNGFSLDDINTTLKKEGLEPLC